MKFRFATLLGGFPKKTLLSDGAVVEETVAKRKPVHPLKGIPAKAIATWDKAIAAANARSADSVDDDQEPEPCPDHPDGCPEECENYRKPIDPSETDAKRWQRTIDAANARAQ